MAIRNLAGANPDAPDLRCVPEARVYGITGTWLHVPQINTLAAMLKGRDGGRVVVGGPVWLSAEELSKDVDHIVRGDGEEVLGYVCAETPPAEWIITGGTVPLDLYGRPARHLWPGPFGGDVFIGAHRYYGAGSATVMASRGCPYRCAFCSSAALCSRKVRWRDPYALVEELEDLVLTYGVRQFRFSDEHMTAQPQRTDALCEAMRRSPILSSEIAWRASVAVRPAEEDLFRSMRAAGCRELSFGIESADPAVLELVCRKGGPAQARRALDVAKRAGLQTRALMMVGLPGETRRTAALNRAFIGEAPFDAVAVTVFVPLPGSPIAEEPADYGVEPIPERVRRSVCAYGPDGLSDVRPTIRGELLSDTEWAAGMRSVLEAAEARGALGHG